MMTQAAEASVEARKAQLLRGLAEIALLHLLKHRSEYGLEILERLRSSAGLNVAEGTIYPLLHRLEKAGSIASGWRIDPAGGRPRRYYSLTALGKLELDALSAEWTRVSNALSAFMESDQ
jgi:PadR family transcriptional regulator PadR